ncbi:hypothetical protein A2961_02085 [Candidatus Woesebacteria bacterium RIFCSPLOWO2_01_FULL_39_21]|uniref:PsbP C-terminal domain-containing protein n=1 Tax=Candidatus Woesebacteria bacterium RIFCSPLOWO2_01_FULL_39_21 TaxID=1802519 RepID=A0A1F8BGY1_9BACT|nr:MAG: hypothetical protein A2691_04285 [Candidatus Woesebacteria bacterium RIFCSPHIGHO2_01_FULL_39_23]OGM63316.1 MAG: hypothetical protein A2961_02085 [Candidatus Woesebacteria bacterium RIFCSPLOWO2_01_FULL_39_21]
MNKNSKGVAEIFIIVILSLLIVGGIGYYAYKNAQIRPVPTTFPTPTVDVTENWKTYKNEKYGFQVNYPTDWIYKEKKEEDLAKSKKTSIIQFSPGLVFNINPGVFSIQLHEIEADLTLREFIDTFICQTSPEGSNCSNISEDINGFSTKNGLAANKIEYHPKLQFAESLVFKKGGTFFELEINFEKPYYEGVSVDERRKMFDQILSTFRFLN